MMSRDQEVYGHFGEWIQGSLGAGGEIVLITLHCRSLRVRVGPGTVADSHRQIFSDERLDGFRRELGIANKPWPRLSSNIPPGCGAGASTATLVALARGAGFEGSPDILAQACHTVEGATDPLMWPEPDGLVWASRTCRVHSTTPPPPRCSIIAGYWGAPQTTDPSDTRFPDVSDLVALWHEASAMKDLPALARLATLSAARCSALRGPSDPMSGLAQQLGALGVIRAHTGSARGLVFRLGKVPRGAKSVLQNAGLSDVFEFETGAA